MSDAPYDCSRFFELMAMGINCTALENLTCNALHYLIKCSSISGAPWFLKSHEYALGNNFNIQFARDRYFKVCNKWYKLKVLRIYKVSWWFYQKQVSLKIDLIGDRLPHWRLTESLLLPINDNI